MGFADDAKGILDRNRMLVRSTLDKYFRHAGPPAAVPKHDLSPESMATANTQRIRRLRTIYLIFGIVFFVAAVVLLYFAL